MRSSHPPQMPGLGYVNVHGCNQDEKEEIGNMFEEKLVDAVALNEVKLKWNEG